MVMRLPPLDLERVRAALSARIPPSWRRPWVGVGLEVGAAAVKAVVVRYQAGRRTLLAAAAVPLPETAARPQRVEALRTVGQAVALSQRRSPVITTAIGGSGVVVRFLTLPAMSSTERRQAVQFQLEQYIPFQPHEVVTDCCPIGPPRQGKQDLLLVAVKQELLQDHLALLREASIAPHAVDLDAVALANAWEVAGAAGPATIGLVNVQPDRAVVTIISDRELKLTRDIALGGGGELSPADPLVADHLIKQVQLSWDYYENQSGRLVERVVVAGVTPVAEAFASLSPEATGRAVERWNPLAAIPRAAGVSLEPLGAAAGDLAVPFGLAVRGLSG